MPNLTTGTMVAPESDRDRARRYKLEYDKAKSYVKQVDARSKQQDSLIRDLQQSIKKKDDQIAHLANPKSTQTFVSGLQDTQQRQVRELETVLAETQSQLRQANSQLRIAREKDNEKGRILNDVFPLLTELQIENLSRKAELREAARKRD